MNKDQLKKILRAYKLKPNHASGQHFLIDPGVLEKIIADADLAPTDTVLEIGPGLGVLTEALLSRVGRVVAVELDYELIKFLQANLINQRLELHHANILSVAFETLRINQPYKIVANLPYSVTSAFFKKFLAETPRPKTIVVLIQKEVALRKFPGGWRGCRSIPFGGWLGSGIRPNEKNCTTTWRQACG